MMNLIESEKGVKKIYHHKTQYNGKAWPKTKEKDTRSNP